MKTIYKILLGVVGVIILGIVTFLIYFNLAFPKVGDAENITINYTPKMIERGKYLANHVTVCIDCHSKRDWSYYSGPIKDGTFGMGGDVFDEKTAGVPGILYSANITPHGIGDWTDGELYRLITTGVTNDNRAIFPLMPYPAYSKMDPNDVKAIIAYLRTLDPIENEVGKSSLNFPLNLIVKTIPSEPKPSKLPDRSNTLAYGKYLTNIAACGDCHTPSEKGTPLPGMEFAGGFEFKSAELGTVRSANITPDKNTGIGNWTEDQFLARFKSYLPDSNGYIPVAKGDKQTVMPWTMYAGMEEQDLRAIYQYLRTLKAVKNRVTLFSKKID